MNQKEYELIAKVFRTELGKLGGTKTQYNYGRADGWRNIALSMVAELENTYTNFDKDKFMKACGL